MFHTARAINTPQELHDKYPVSTATQKFIAGSRDKCRQILNSQSLPLLLVVGPCSIHDLTGAKEYAKRLKCLADEVAGSFFIIMRAYFEKPRTSLGWKGIIHDPFLDGTHQIGRGYELSRELLLYLAELKVPAACEFLDPLTAAYNGDLITWSCIGARTASSQVHRQMASNLEMPVAFKNTTDGSIENAVNGCLTASEPHAFLGLDLAGNLAIHHSKGNPDTHVVLRGGVGKPNYQSPFIDLTRSLLRSQHLPERVLIDCSHDNCEKKHDLQPLAFKSVLTQFQNGSEIIRGLMLESYLYSGNQPHKNSLNALQFGVSITDPCLSWDETADLVRAANHDLQQLKSKR